MSVLRPIDAADHEAVLDLNERNVELLSPMDQARLEQLLGWATHAHVIESGLDKLDRRMAGFLLTFAAGCGYDGFNFAELSRRYDSFLYLDRIVIADDFRRRGLAGLVYDEIEADAARLGRLVLEVNSEPPNEPSLAFHHARGYVGIGEHEPPYHPGTSVLLMAKEL